MSGPVPPFRKAGLSFMACARATLLRSMTPLLNFMSVVYHIIIIIIIIISTLLSFVLLHSSWDVLFCDCYATFQRGRCQSVDRGLLGSTEVISRGLPKFLSTD